MENAPRNNATREQGSCSRIVKIADFLLLVIGLSLLAGCAAAGKARVVPTHSVSDTRLERLAKFVPARYDKPEVFGEDDVSLFEIERPAPPAAPAVKGEAPAADPSAAVTVEQSEDAARAAEGNEHGSSAKE